MATEVDIKDLLQAGAHFGHKTSRWHPKMAQYIHSKRDGTHIIDLTKTVTALEEVLPFITKTVSEGKQILFVGTKRQAKDIVQLAAKEAGMPFVTERWLGGMLTNKKTIGERIKHLKDIEARMENGQLEAKYNKLEIQRFQEEIDQMNFLYGGVKDLAARPGAVFVVDVINETNALKEAKKLGLKTIAIADTNADPSDITYPIPANDDAIKTIQLILDYIKSAIAEGKAKQKAAPVADKKEDGEDK
ncbi:MAG: 30S ribosomal protein S2 [Candidatus Saccharibacteria bacterium]|nr:30S ribosomal protein S2 [Candidatus Saccharibacteria bacterium]